MRTEPGPAFIRAAACQCGGVKFIDSGAGVCVEGRMTAVPDRRGISIEGIHNEKAPARPVAIRDKIFPLKAARVSQRTEDRIVEVTGTLKIVGADGYVTEHPLPPQNKTGGSKIRLFNVSEI
jgi:hypothetical protein